MKDLKPQWQAKYTWQLGSEAFIETFEGPITRAEALMAFRDAYPSVILLSLYEL